MKTISVVIDAGNEMNRLYAETHHDMGWMSNEEFGLYRRVDEALAEKNAFKTPDLRFFLSAPFEIVAERIRERGRMFELKMLDEHPEYFLRLNDVIEVFVGKQNNVIRIDTDKNDFIDETHINGIVEKISNIK
jgi:deoxyadenosine/deoxycytidine kinase